MTLAIEGTLDALPGTTAELERGVAAGLQLGGQICVWREGREVADAGFGLARRDPEEPMRRDHRVLWMSSSKPVAAIAILRLWERGALGLDDPVARHVPEFAAGGKEAVTVRHLLTHTGGVRMLDTGWPEASWEEVVARVCARPLEPRWTPGRRAGYHLASSWFVLGEIVRRLEGRAFERVVRETIFEPLGMTGCWIGVPGEVHERERGSFAPMFVAAGEQLAASDLASAEKLVPPSPGGNGVGPVRELARLYRALAAGGELDGARILAPQTVEVMAARHRVGLVDQTFRTKLDWGLGVIVDSKHYGDPDAPYGYGPHAGPRSWGHSGSRSSTAFVDPDAGLVVALAVNAMTRSEEEHRIRFERLTAAVYEDLGLAS